MAIVSAAAPVVLTRPTTTATVLSVDVHVIAEADREAEVALAHHVGVHRHVTVHAALAARVAKHLEVIVDMIIVVVRVCRRSAQAESVQQKELLRFNHRYRQRLCHRRHLLKPVFGSPWAPHTRWPLFYISTI